MSWLEIACQRPVLIRGIRLAAIVSPLLIAVHHWDTLLYGQVTAVIVIKMILTPLIPFCVSVYSSVSTIIRRQRVEAGEE